jgi:hypothetical protein
MLQVADDAVLQVTTICFGDIVASLLIWRLQETRVDFGTGAWHLARELTSVACNLPCTLLNFSEPLVSVLFGGRSTAWRFSTSLLILSHFVRRPKIEVESRGITA